MKEKEKQRASFVTERGQETLPPLPGQAEFISSRNHYRI